MPVRPWSHAIITVALCLAGCVDPHTGRVSVARTLDRFTPETFTLSGGVSDAYDAAVPYHTILIGGSLTWRLKERRYERVDARGEDVDPALDPLPRGRSRASMPPPPSATDH